MMAMMEKAMYLKGLYDGIQPDLTTKEGKLIAALLDMVTEMAREIDDMQAKMSDLEDYCEELDEDLGDVEEVLLDVDTDEDDESFDDFDECDGNCASCDFDCGLDDEFFDEDEDEEEDDGEFFQVICPACGDEINFDSTIDPENLRCPGCGEKIECIVDEDDYKKLSEEE